MSAAVYMQSLNILRDKYIKVALKISASNLGFHWILLPSGRKMFILSLHFDSK